MIGVLLSHWHGYRNVKLALQRIGPNGVSWSHQLLSSWDDLVSVSCPGGVDLVLVGPEFGMSPYGEPLWRELELLRDRVGPERMVLFSKPSNRSGELFKELGALGFIHVLEQRHFDAPTRILRTLAAADSLRAIHGGRPALEARIGQLRASSPGGCPPEPSQIRARRFPPLGSSVEESYGALAQI
jgi:hypothetical protein